MKLPDEDWGLMLQYLCTEEMKKYETFAEKGKRSRGVAFVVSGTFRQDYTKDGEERTTYLYFAGDLMCA